MHINSLDHVIFLANINSLKCILIHEETCHFQDWNTFISIARDVPASLIIKHVISKVGHFVHDNIFFRHAKDAMMLKFNEACNGGLNNLAKTAHYRKLKMIRF